MSSDTALLIHPIQPKDDKKALPDHIREAEGLIRAIGLDISETFTPRVNRPAPAHFLGKGSILKIKNSIEKTKSFIVIFNGNLSPVQQRNLEHEWSCKVIDRTGLILEIFGARAQTKEGKIQIELAALQYQRSRLVRSWTHLERQRGGAGFMGGPGETQIEIDRRLIDKRIVRLKKDLEKVRKTRALQRRGRAKVPFPVVALVGYTNAGKSTLFNQMTGADVFAEDLLFATLDPTVRKLRLPDGQNVVLSDTVGFIADLPTSLVAAFRATLEEVVLADIILHVRDISRPDHETQRDSVISILEDLGIDYEEDPRVIELWNKVDLLNKEEESDARRHAKFYDRPAFVISALTGKGHREFLNMLSKYLLT